MTESVTSHELICRALAAYFRRLPLIGPGMEPTLGHSEVVEDHRGFSVHLRNQDGPVASYRYCHVRDRLTWVGPVFEATAVCLSKEAA